MKRKAVQTDEDSVPHPRTRRQLAVAGPEATQITDVDHESLDRDNVSDSGADSVSYADNSSSTPADSANTPLTGDESVPSPNKKFPSDLKTIRCPEPGCGKTFNRPARLKAHLRSHNNERPFACTVEGCDKTYIEEKHLKQHMKASHSDERDYTCAVPECGKKFLTKTRLSRHEDMHRGLDKYRCKEYPPCNETFRKHQTLQRHIRAAHLKEPAFSCAQHREDLEATCEAAFETANALKRHLEREHGEIQYWCDECANKDNEEDRVGFPTKELLQKHMQKAHINCMFCVRVFSSRSVLDSHIESQHSMTTLSERKNVKCTWPGCDKAFVKKYNLTVHVRSVHEGERWFCGKVDLSGNEEFKNWPITDGCNNGFVTKGNLEDHVRYVHLGKQRPPPPRVVAPQPSLTNNVLGHMSGSAATERTRYTLICTAPDCSLRFAHKADLERHMQNWHPERLPALGIPAPAAGLQNQQVVSHQRVLADQQAGFNQRGLPDQQAATHQRVLPYQQAVSQQVLPNSQAVSPQQVLPHRQVVSHQRLMPDQQAVSHQQALSDQEILAEMDLSAQDFLAAFSSGVMSSTTSQSSMNPPQAGFTAGYLDEMAPPHAIWSSQFPRPESTFPQQQIQNNGFTTAAEGSGMSHFGRDELLLGADHAAALPSYGQQWSYGENPADMEAAMEGAVDPDLIDPDLD